MKAVSVVITAISGTLFVHQPIKVPSLGQGNYQPRWLATLGHRGDEAVISNLPASICCSVKGFK